MTLDALELSVVDGVLHLRCARGRFPDGRPIDVPAATLDLRKRDGAEVFLNEDGSLSQEAGLIRVARVVRDRGIQLDPWFIPAIAHIRAWPPLMERLRRLVELLSRRQKAYREVEDPRKSGLREVLLIIGAHLPVLRHLMLQPSTSPEQLYVELIRLRGAFSLFGRAELQEPPPPFDEDALGLPLLGVLEDLHTEALGVITPYSYAILPLERRADGMYLGRFDDPSLAQTKRFFLLVKGPDGVRDKVPAGLKIASWTGIGDILKTDAPGVVTRAAGRLPRDLRFLQGQDVRELDQGCPAWFEIIGSRTIAMYQPVQVDDVELVLYFVG